METPQKNILIVEDTANIRRLVKLLLEEEGYNVIEAENGKNGLDLIKLQDFDMIFTDVRMPVMDGLTFLGQVMKVAPDIPVALLTSFDSAQYATEALRLGAFSFCTKPVNVNEVKRVAKKGIELRRIKEAVSKIKPYTRKSLQFTIPSKTELIPGLTSETVKMMKADGLSDDIITMVRTALMEAVENAVIHGNKEDEKKNVEIAFNMVAESIEISVTDTGAGFDHKTALAADDTQIVTTCGGKGVFIIQCNMDKVVYNESGNSVMMTKKIHAEP